MKVEFDIRALIAEEPQQIAPPLAPAVLFVKIELNILPLAPPHQTLPPPILAELLKKVQFSNIPSLPDHKTAPPYPLEKLKFTKPMSFGRRYYFKVNFGYLIHQ